MNTRKIVPVHHKTLVRLFEIDGFAVKRQKGDHIMMTKPGINRPLVIKTSPREVPTTHIRTNLTTAGISRSRYFELLDSLS
jgi:predicted RNA binding protein YcfA (HicA-like mRNA interferase family)